MRDAGNPGSHEVQPCRRTGLRASRDGFVFTATEGRPLRWRNF